MDIAFLGVVYFVIPLALIVFGLSLVLRAVRAFERIAISCERNCSSIPSARPAGTLQTPAT